MHFSKLGNQLHQVRFNFEHGRRGSLCQGGDSRSISPSTFMDCEGTEIGGRWNVNLDYFGKLTSCNISIVMFCMNFYNPVLL